MRRDRHPTCSAVQQASTANCFSERFAKYTSYQRCVPALCQSPRLPPLVADGIPSDDRCNASVAVSIVARSFIFDGSPTASTFLLRASSLGVLGILVLVGERRCAERREKAFSVSSRRGVVSLVRIGRGFEVLLLLILPFGFSSVRSSSSSEARIKCCIRPRCPECEMCCTKRVVPAAFGNLYIQRGG